MGKSFKSNVSIGNTYKITNTSPIDDRFVVDTFNDLIKAETWYKSTTGADKNIYIYRGIAVVTKDTGLLYVYKEDVSSSYFLNKKEAELVDFVGSLSDWNSVNGRLNDDKFNTEEAFNEAKNLALTKKNLAKTKWILQSPVLSLDKDDSTGNYTLKSNGVSIGTIDLSKDKVVSGGTVEKFSLTSPNFTPTQNDPIANVYLSDNWYILISEGKVEDTVVFKLININDNTKIYSLGEPIPAAKDGGTYSVPNTYKDKTYIFLSIANSDEKPLMIPADSLVDKYQGYDGNDSNIVTTVNGNEIIATIKSNSITSGLLNSDLANKIANSVQGFSNIHYNGENEGKNIITSISFSANLSNTYTPSITLNTTDDITSVDLSDYNTTLPTVSAVIAKVGTAVQLVTGESDNYSSVSLDPNALTTTYKVTNTLGTIDGCKQRSGDTNPSTTFSNGLATTNLLNELLSWSEN